MTVTDETLYALTARQRVVLRRMAEGGWADGTGPGQATIDATATALGLSHGWNSERVRGEHVAYYPTLTDWPEWQALAERLDQLPRRDNGRRRQAPR